MASFLTLLSRYIGKKTKFVEKQQAKTEKEKKQKVKQFAKEYPSHDKQLKAWEKTYGEKKQAADAKFENERKKRVMGARKMGPAKRQKKYRSASVYMAKDPYTKPPVKPRGAGKTTYLTKKAKKKNDFITKMNAPIKEELLKENTRMSMPPHKDISQSLIDAVKQAQLNQPASVDKPLDMSLKGVDNKQPIKEETVDEGNRLQAAGAALKNLATDGASTVASASATGYKFGKIAASKVLKKKLDHEGIGVIGGAIGGTIGLAKAAASAVSTYSSEKNRLDKADTLKAALKTKAAKKSSSEKPNKAFAFEEFVSEAHPSDPHFIKQQIDGHRKAAAEAKKRGDHHRAMAHEQQARDYEQHGMHGSRFETSSGLKYEEVTVTEGAKKIKLTPGMKPKDFKAQKTAMKQKVVAKAKKAAAKRATPSLPKVSSAPANGHEEEDDKMLSRLLKGKLKHGDHPHLAKAIVSKIRTTHVKDRAEMQKKIYHAKGSELDSLLK